jgi:hypothetical protein
MNNGKMYLNEFARLIFPTYQLLGSDAFVVG